MKIGSLVFSVFLAFFAFGSAFSIASKTTFVAGLLSTKYELDPSKGKVENGQVFLYFQESGILQVRNSSGELQTVTIFCKGVSIDSSTTYRHYLRVNRGEEYIFRLKKEDCNKATIFIRQ